MAAKNPPQGSASRLAAFRKMLDRHPRVALIIRAARALIHFGPWRSAARWYFRQQRPPAQSGTTGLSVIPNLDAAAVAAKVRADSVCVVEPLPAPLVDAIRQLTDHLPPNEYGSFAGQSSAVKRLVEDPGVRAVARTYFGAEPVLLECNLVVQASEQGRRIDAASQRRFHFDYAGWQSLNMFVYLTDVDPDAGAHQVVMGTHIGKSIRDAVRTSLDDEEVERRFATQVCTIAGPAGTVFFEDTEAFHRRVGVKHRRVMLNVLFASHRGAFSRGRLVESHQDIIARVSSARGRAQA
jgi:hypothetical protein